MTCLIIAEKPSAARNFAKALGGVSGSFEGQSYRICALRGHLLELEDPIAQVPVEKKDSYGVWNLDAIPWDVSDFAFKRKVASSMEDVFKAVSIEIRNLKPTDELVIATDVDPSGEGELLAWEVLDAVGFDPSRIPTSRMYFIDEGEKFVQKAFLERKPIASKDLDGDYLKAEARSRWDFLSMQLTRIATIVARERSCKEVIRQGRLKSVMVSLVGSQLDEIANYKKIPYYEIRFRDEQGNVYKEPEEASSRVSVSDDLDLNKYSSSEVIADSVEQKTKAPERLLDLAALSSILAKRGFKPKQILSDYQKMYEDQIVSYPRTEDKTITTEQFKEMLPLVDRIADVVGVDKTLLTHRLPRKTHVKDSGSHGANRPGVNIPNDLSSLSSYGPAAPAIYELLAKNFLAMFGEDYQYEIHLAHLKDYPSFITKAHVPICLGYKEIFSSEDENEDKVSIGLGKEAEPYIHEGCNKPPAKPTMQWLMNKLKRYNVGTGATRTSTFSDITSGASALISETKGKLSLTDTGCISFKLLENTMIGNVSVTEKLFENMECVGRFEKTVDDVVHSITPLIKHDLEAMKANAEKLPRSDSVLEIGKCPICGEAVVKRGKILTCTSNKSEKIDGVWKDVAGCGFKIFPFCGKEFTQKQATALLSGNAITLKGCKSKAGKIFDCKVRLKNNELVPEFNKK